MNKKTTLLCIVLAIVFFIVAGVFVYRNVVAFTEYDKVNAVVRINYEHTNEKHNDRVAYFTYTYKGQVYSDVRTMNFSSSWTSGDSIGIYVNPSSPRDIVIIGYFVPAACVAIGIVFIVVGVAIAKKDRGY